MITKMNGGNSRRTGVFYLLIAFSLLSGAVSAQQGQPTAQTPQVKDSNPLKLLQWRSIGPFRGPVGMVRQALENFERKLTSAFVSMLSHSSVRHT